MAIVWGSWSSNSRLRAGIEMTMSPSTVSSSTSSVTITTKVYLQTRYASNESGSSTTWWISGGLAASGNTDWNLGDNGYVLMGTATKTVSTSYTATTTVSATGKIHSYYAYPGTEASVSTSITVPKRPIVAPAAPTGFTVTRSSDTSQSLAWTRSSTDGAPVTYTDIQRSTDGGTYTQIATPGNVGTYSDTGTSANHKYTYKIRTRNSAGSSAWVTSSTISTTPAAPAAPTATKSSSGDIVVTRPSLSSVATQWEVWHAAGGVWDSARIALVAAGTTSWTHTAPSNTATHTYKIKAVSASPTLYSAFSPDSNTVQLLAAPNAPTALAPSGTARDATEDATFSWKHNPVDTTAQTAYEIQWRPTGTTTWSTTGKVTSGTSSRLFPGGTWTNGQTIEWQVRTYGSFATASPWSASATLPLSARPTAAINYPDTTLTTSLIEVQWGYADAEGTAQAAYIVQLIKDGEVIEEISEAGSATSATFETRAVNGASYTVTVAVQDGSGLWSSADPSDFVVAFASPPVPDVSAEWDPSTGAVAVTVDTPGPSETEVDATSVSLYRGDGETWTLVAAGLPITTTALDPIPPLNATVLYRVEAVSDLPSTTDSATVSVETPASAVYVNGGPGFGSSIPLLVDPTVTDTTARDRAIVFFAGRKRPLEIAGEAVQQTYAVTASLFDDGTTPSRSDVRDFVVLSGPACLRDPEGLRVFVSIGDATVSGAGKESARGLSWSFTEIDFAESPA